MRGITRWSVHILGFHGLEVDPGSDRGERVYGETTLGREETGGPESEMGHTRGPGAYGRGPASVGADVPSENSRMDIPKAP